MASFKGRVDDIFVVNDVAFVVPDATMGEAESSAADITAVIAPAVAVDRGAVSPATLRLWEQWRSDPHRAKLSRAILEKDAGGINFAWKIEWKILPLEGVFMGRPDIYRSILRADGTLVRPDLYLCDWCQPALPEDSPALFSVLAIDELLLAQDRQPDSEEIVRAAKEAFEKSVPQAVIESAEFRALPPVRRTIPSQLGRGNGEGKDLEVWGVHFSAHSPARDRENDETSLVVWVNSKLKTSKVSLGRWTIEDLSGRVQTQARGKEPSSHGIPREEGGQ